MKDNSTESGRQFYISIILSVITIITGLISFQAVFPDYPFLRKLYYTFQLFTMESGDRFYEQGNQPLWITIIFNISRYLAIATLITTIVLAILSVLSDKFLHSRIRHMKNHTILCGLGDIGISIVENYPDKSNLLIIEKDTSNENITRLKEAGAKILQANALDTEKLKEAGIEHAKYLLALTGRDFDNLTIVKNAIEQIKNDTGKGKATIIANIDSRNLKVSVVDEWKNRKNQNTCILKDYLAEYYSTACKLIEEKSDEKLISELQEKKNNIKKLLLTYDPADDPCKNNMENVKLFNINQLAARYIFLKFPPDRFRKITKTTDQAMHLLMMGYSQIGEELLKLFAQNCHFINRKKTKITLVCLDGDAVKERILSKYRNIGEIIDLQIIDHNPHHMTISFMESNNISDVDVIYICSGEDRFQASYSSRARELIDNNVPVIRPFYQSTVLNRTKTINNVYSFNILRIIAKLEYIVDETIDQKAIAVHNRWLKQEKDQYVKDVEECLNEVQKGIAERKEVPEPKPTLIPWYMLDEEIREDNRSAVDHINIKLRSLGQLTDPDYFDYPGKSNVDYNFINDSKIVEQLAEMEHRRWMANKYLYGWEYGKQRDVKARKHESLIDFEKLDKLTRDIDLEQVKHIREIIEIN